MNPAGGNFTTQLTKYFQAGTSLPQVPVKIMSKWLSFLHKDAIISGPMPKKLSKRILFVHERPKTWDLFESNSIEAQKAAEA